MPAPPIHSNTVPPTTDRAAPSPVAPAADRGLVLLLALLAGITLYRALVLHFSGLTLYVDEAQYWTWAKHLAWGFYSKPPVIAAVIAATTSVCGDGELCVKSGSLLIYPLVALLIWATARRLFPGREGVRIAFWSALVFFTLPGAAFSAMIISTDVPLFLCWAAAFYAWLRAIEDDRWRWWLFAGLAGGIGLLTKYTMVIFAVSALLHLAATPSLRRHLRNPKLYATMALAALIFLPNIVWNARHGWPTLKHTTDISGLDQPGTAHLGLHWHELIAFIGGQAAIVGPVFFVAWILQLLRFQGWRTDERYRALAWFALPFLGIIALQALFGRANANWAAMAYATATIFVVAMLIEEGRLRWLLAGLAFNLAVTVLAYHYDFIARTAGIAMNHRTDVYKRVRGWDRIGAQAMLPHKLFPDALFLADDRDVLAELEYYVTDPHPLDAVQWNPQHIINSHYALTTTMENKQGRDFIYVARSAELPPLLAASFSGANELMPLHAQIDSDYALDFHVWLLHDYLGPGSRTAVRSRTDAPPG